MISKYDACTGCGACLAACPVDAIRMAEDADGFLYPCVNPQACIRCEKCSKICAARLTFRQPSQKKCYAVSSIPNEYKRFSSSGGAFAALAEAVLEDGGYVCGAAYVEGKPFQVQHRIIREKQELPLIQGSKYVPSNAWAVFPALRSILETGKTVLFSGTPCLVAGLKSFLGTPYPNLFTVEVICHGIPSEKLFREYLEQSFGGDVEEFIFRDKRFGWGYTASVRMKSGEKKSIHRKSSSYYDGFIKERFLRKSCYVCSFANEDRCADITLGDFWGVFKNHRKELLKNAAAWQDGVSACVINTDAGEALFASASKKMNLIAASFEEISRENSRLLHGKPIPKSREALMEQYRAVGYAGIEADFQKHKENARMVQLKALIPGRVKFLLKCLK